MQPCKAAFDQIMAKNLVVRKTLVQRRLEGLQIIDPFADEAPLTEDILVDITDLICIRIDSLIASKKAVPMMIVALYWIWTEKKMRRRMRAGMTWC